MKNKFFYLLAITLCIIGCKKLGNTCSNTLNFQIELGTSEPCKSTGFIKVIDSLNTGFRYQLNDGVIQEEPSFSNLKPGSYVIKIFRANNCVSFKTFTIDTIQPSQLFLEVKSILINRCVNCHSGVNPHAGIDFSKNCDILNKWDRIQARAIEGFPTPMPQEGLIPKLERSLLYQWIENGHKYNN